MAFTSTWSSLIAAQTDANSPLDTTLMDGMRQDIDYLREYIADKTAYTPSTSHNHNGTNSAVIAVPTTSVGTTQLRTATGVVTAISTINPQTVQIAMNDYSFTPSMSLTAGFASTNVTIHPWSTTDPSNTVGLLALRISTSEISVTTTIRWRYMTASDNPTVWAAYSSAGKISALWMADDPIDIMNEIHGVKIKRDGSTMHSINIPMEDLHILSTLSDIPDEIRLRGKHIASSKSREPVRILQEYYKNPAEAIISNCSINTATGKLKLKDTDAK